MHSSFLTAIALLFSIAPAYSFAPPVPKTALEWTAVYAASVDRAGQALAQATDELLRRSVLNADQARPVSLTCVRLAEALKAVREITDASTETSWRGDAARIRELVAGINLDFLPSGVGTNPTLEVRVTILKAALTLLRQEVR